MSVFKRIINKALKTAYFLGRRTSIWLVIGGLSGAIAGFSELGLTFLLQALFVSLGLVDSEIYSFSKDFIAQLSTPPILLIGLLIVIAIKGICLFLSNQASAVAQELINARLRCIAIHDLLHREGFVSAGEVNTRIGDTFPKASQFALYGSLAVPSLIQCAVLIVFMFLIAWRESVLSIIFIAGISFVIWKTNKQVSRIAGEIPKEQRALVRGIERVARNWLLVRILRTGEIEEKRLNQNILNYSARFSKSRLLANAATSLPIVLGGIMLVGLVGLHFLGLSTSGAVLIAFLYLLVRFTQQLASFARNYGMASSCYPHFVLSVQYFFSFSNTQLEVALHPSKQLGFIRRGRPQPKQTSVITSGHRPQPPKIEIKNLSFRYGGKHPYVFQNLEFSIPARSQFGIVGRSGTGKSTLLSLILGVLEPTQGEVLIDGKHPKQYFNNPLVRLGYVGAEPFLIEGSIADNLRYGAIGEYSEHDFWEALRFAKIDDVISQKPGTLNFQLKENGEGLSAGQKQRLALARAFLTKPQVLVLDEASANLDETTEAEITQALATQTGESTIIIVSHREGILKNCDNILDLSQLQPRLHAVN